MSDLPPHDRFPYGLDPERPRPWLDDEPPHHAGDDEPDAREPERLRCRSCGQVWDEPKLNTDGVCPFCVLELNER